MTIDDNTIEKIAKLANLQIPQDKKEALKEELGAIINYVENLNEIDVSNIDATFTTLEGGTPLREDIVSQDLELSKHVLKHSPKSEDGFFVVPKIIE